MFYLNFYYRHRTTFLRRKIASWDFCPFDVDHDDLIHCSYLIFEQVLTFPEMSHISVNKGKNPRSLLFHFLFRKVMRMKIRCILMQASPQITL